MTQYVNWIDGIVHGDFGDSVRYKSDVWSLIEQRIPYSLKLCGWSLVLEISGGFAAGFCFLRHEKDGFLDRFTVNFSMLMAAVLVLLAWRPVHTSVRSLAGMAAHKRIQQRQHYILPVVTTVLASMGGTLRLTKSEVLDVFNRKYVTTAYAKRTRKDSDDKACAA